MWHYVWFGDLSTCHDVTLLNFVTIPGFCHAVRIFLDFLSTSKMWYKTVRSYKCYKPKACTRFLSHVPQIYWLRGYVSLGQTSENPEFCYWPCLRSRFWISLGTTVSGTKNLRYYYLNEHVFFRDQTCIDDHDSDFSARDSESDFSALFGSSWSFLLIGQCASPSSCVVSCFFILLTKSKMWHKT